VENEAVINETQATTETGVESQIQEPRVSKLAVASLVFGIFGPFSAGTLRVLSFADFLSVGNPRIITLFACSLAWILGLIFGIKSLEQIETSQGQLLGREYAVVGICVSVIWMIVILAGLLLPASFSVNS